MRPISQEEDKENFYRKVRWENFNRSLILIEPFKKLAAGKALKKLNNQLCFV